MARWEARANERLRNGETVEASVPVGENGVVVTSHRVFAFTPTSDGRNFRAVERPNVEGVGTAATSEIDWLGRAGKAALAGVAGVALGLTVDFGTLLDLGEIGSQGAGRLGMGGMLAVLQRISQLLGLLDDALLVGGLLALAGALGALGLYLQSRTKTLRIAVAGGPDLHVPAADRGDAVVRLRRHLVDGDSSIPVDTGADSSADEGPAVDAPGTDTVPGGDDPPDRGTLGTVLDSLRADGPDEE
ncbi:hypothetical protein SAMN05216388_1003119 [Halorientalis persicus]|uniref:Uncharacterized protein n=1 Tax=Halorientalis persicus TaxID=1367881 RepID=A0A1H8GKZ5_9EURY|nr:hypothetical protein [Halorientalis persicus]SEN44157.1 hypothetical protein SAMN05216388_1003119 [Halorientalis persicus]